MVNECKVLETQLVDRNQEIESWVELANKIMAEAERYEDGGVMQLSTHGNDAGRSKE